MKNDLFSNVGGIERIISNLHFNINPSFDTRWEKNNCRNFNICPLSLAKIILSCPKLSFSSFQFSNQHATEDNLASKSSIRRLVSVLTNDSITAPWHQTMGQFDRQSHTDYSVFLCLISESSAARGAQFPRPLIYSATTIQGQRLKNWLFKSKCFYLEIHDWTNQSCVDKTKRLKASWSFHHVVSSYQEIPKARAFLEHISSFCLVKAAQAILLWP